MMFGSWGKQTDKASRKLTVALPAGLADIISARATTSSQDESEVITELLTEALIYVHGHHESEPLVLNTPIVRTANGVMIQAIESRVDTLHIVPMEDGLRLRHLREGDVVLPTGPEPVENLALHLHQPLFTRYERMASPVYGPKIAHPENIEKGQIPITLSGRNYNIGLQFLPREPNAIGETLELTFEGPLEES
jgi:hypothetical protein